MADPTPRQQSIEKAIEQAERVNARHLARLYLDRLRAAVHTLDAGDFLELVEGLEDEDDRPGAEAVKHLRFPPGDPAA